MGTRAIARTTAPEMWEWPLALAAIAFLVWQSEPFRDPQFLAGAGERYQQAIERQVSIPAQARAGEDLASLEAAQEALARALAVPVREKLARLDVLENRAREARADANVQSELGRIAAQTRAYREAYGIPAGETRSLPLECGWNHLAARAHAGSVEALASLAAILEGDSRRALAGLESSRKAPAWSRAEREAGCAALGSPRQAIGAAAKLVAAARASETSAAKSAAMQRLLANVHWIFALWAAAGLALLQLARLPVPIHRFLPLAALVWCALGWASGVRLEWVSDRMAQTAWLLGWGFSSAEFFQLAATAAGVALIASAMIPGGRDSRSRQPQTPSSRFGYAGFVLFAGLGWWLALDLSATGHFANRFHALYQEVYVFAAFALLTMLAPLRLALASMLVRSLGFLLLLARPRRGVLRRCVPWIVYGALAALLLALAAATHRTQTQLTSEIFRLWLVLGVAWFFFVRGEPALTLAAGGLRGAWHGFVFLLPLFFVLGVPVLGLVLTDDFGPLFVMLYAASIFVGTAFAFAFVDRAGYRPWVGGSVGALVAAAWVYLMTFALYSVPAPLARVAERLASVRSPFTATNDQMAILTWFQESAPAAGYGFGGVPWCGESSGAACRGVPKQIQSDYVFTALAGVYGKAAALALVALLALWLVRLVIHHGRATRGIVEPGSPVATQQAWLSWVAVCWVGLTLAQLAVTVAGNLGWLPLTGITFPFASFGAWSLAANTFFLALAIHLPRKA
jgi:cell division protein FtsW (lipid II flippase)